MKLQKLKDAASGATPGPWQADVFANGAFDIYTDSNDVGRYMVICARGPHDLRAAEMAANARLIAACSPERILALVEAVEALRKIVAADDEGGLTQGMVEEARDTLSNLEKLP